MYIYNLIVVLQNIMEIKMGKIYKYDPRSSVDELFVLSTILLTDVELLFKVDPNPHEIHFFVEAFQL